MGRLESPLEAWCVKWARAREIIVAKLTQVDGIPDRVFFLPGGRPLVVEFKGRKKRGKGLQEKTQPWYVAKLRQDGYEAHCCDTKEQFLGLMRNLGRRTDE